MDEDRVLPFEADSRFFHRRAVRSIDKQDYLTALRHLRRAQEMDPQDAQIALDLADAYARMGLYEMANVELELLLGRDDCPEETNFAIGCNYMAMGDYAQAYSCFAAYLSDYPRGEFSDMAQDGIAQIEESEMEDGIDRELEALAEQGKAALDCGDAERAAQLLSQVLEKDPSLLYVRNNLALAYMCMEDNVQAWKQLNLILQEDGANVHACCNAALLLNAEGLRDKAAAYMDRLDPERMEELDELYKYCLTVAEMKNDQKLLAGLKCLLLLCPYETSMLYLYGLCLYNQGRRQEAARVLEKLMAIEPSNVMARDVLRYCAEDYEGERPKELPYIFDYSDEVIEDLEQMMSGIVALYPDHEAMDKSLREHRDQMDAALLGDDELVEQALLVLGTAGGPLAEQMLRRLLLSVTHSSEIKRGVVDCLLAIGAPAPYIGYIDGHIVRVQREALAFRVAPPKAYAQFLNEMMQEMEKRYGPGQPAAYGLQLWVCYLNSLNGRYPPLRDKAAWLAATCMIFEEDVLGQKPDLKETAEREGCTQRTLLMRMRRLYSAAMDMEEE